MTTIGVGTAVRLWWDAPRFKALLHLPPILAERDAIFPALFAAVLAMVVVSAVTPKPAPAQLAQGGISPHPLRRQR
ncbi:MAG: hypothetical protein ACRD3N_03355 [Terracidiphilus sp.]